MKRNTFIIICSAVLFGCDEPLHYPEKTDLNNRLVDYISWDFNQHAMKELLETASEDSARYNDFFQLHESTTRLLDYIEDLKNEIVDKSGGYDENGMYSNPNEVDNVERFMIQGNAATEFKTKLGEFSRLLESLGLDKNQIAIVPQQNPLLKNDPRFYDSSFEQLHFQNTRMIDCLTVLENYKMQILLYQGLAVNVMLMEKSNGKTTFDMD